MSGFGQPSPGGFGQPSTTAGFGLSAGGNEQSSSVAANTTASSSGIQTGSSGRGGRGGGSGSGSRQGSGPKPSAVEANLGTIHGDLFTRPADLDKRGSDGDPVACLANFVKITTFPEFNIYQYHVQFVPEVDSKSARQAILNHPSITDHIGNLFIFDGMIMYLPKEWSREEALESVHPTTNSPVNVIFKNSVRFTHNDAQAINCYNIVLRRCFDQIGLQQMGRNYFDSQRGQAVPEAQMEIWPGYETAIRLYEDGLMLCVENRFKMLRQAKMLDVLRMEYRRCSNDNRRFQEKVQETFANSTVMTHYNNKMYRLTRFDFEMTPNSTFTRSDGVAISLRDYFQSQYNLTIEDMTQPIIISEGKSKQPGEAPQLSFLLPELCHPTGLTDEMRKDMRMMRALSHHTRLSPAARRDSTIQLIKRIKADPNCVALLEAWQLHLDDNLVDVRARRLPAQKLIGKNPAGYTGRNAEWARECKTGGNFSTKTMANWILVSPMENPEDGNIANMFKNEVRKIGNDMRMAVAEPLCQAIDSSEVTDYIEGVRKALDQASAKGVKVDMIAVLLKNDNKTRYDTLKKFLCIDCPVPSQCVLQKTIAGRPADGGINKNLGSIVLKILLQMNCKMGGAIWKVNIPLKNTMIIGYDLYHDSTVRGKTVGACVSTIDGDYTQYYSQTRLHENATELGNNLSHFLRKALRRYYEKNNSLLPERIFLYRDGAGDGQIPFIRDHEVRLVREACTDVCKRVGLPAERRIQLAFTIVTKKVNMRVFKNLGGSQIGNPDPGTVVDSVVTRPERFDFYLVPQFVNQGTVTPVCYNVIHDDTGLSPDRHQSLAFKLCHLYYNWQGTVRVPAPCQYAHKLAFLVAQSIHKEADESLRDKLFFL